MTKLFLLIVCLLFFSLCASAQNTVGVLLHNTELVQDGYNLLMPNEQSTIYLTDNCGRIINTWESNELSRVGADLYLLEDGSVLRAKADVSLTSGPTIGAGGVGGVVEILSWDNEILWQKIIQDSLMRQHHDVQMMPNGNVLAIVWDRKYKDEIIANGLDSIYWEKDELWPDMIVEYDTATSNIVWEWRAWDHLVQQVYPEKLNYGIIKDHPELIDINYQNYTFGRKDWMHCNSLHYNPELDQILLSVRNFNEVWIIDHSTSLEEATGHTGGNAGKGGDILWRWGNPEAFDRGDINDRLLFYNHDANWLNEDYHHDTPYDGMISIYNNFIDGTYSLVSIVNPNLDSSDYNYAIDEGSQYFVPSLPYEVISHPDTLKQYSAAGSNFQILPNGNFLFHAARQGRTTEMTSQREPVYEYLVPFRNGFRVNQGEVLNLSDNFTFSLRRYPSSHPAFFDKDLTPGEYLEYNANTGLCQTVSQKEVSEFMSEVYPNPVNNFLNVDLKNESYLKIMNSFGGIVYSELLNSGTHNIDCAKMEAGIYFIQIYDTKLELHITQRIVKL
ncbi:MAG: hypothetical protein ACJA1A_002047 [Saprospiraceae bacterium]|jgi:hypothetical protein